MELGINTFGMGRLLKAPFRQTIQTLKENGITALEPCIHFQGKKTGTDPLLELGMKLTDRLGGIWMPNEAKEKIAILRAKGFRVEGAHLFISELTADMTERALHFAKENDLRYYVLSYMTDRFEQAAKHIPLLRHAVRVFRAQGVHLLLHNHDKDMKETEGLCVLDFLLHNIPELELELDLGWVSYAGLDCVRAMDKYRERLRILHFKDMWPGTASKKPHFCAVGEGRLPMTAIMEKTRDLELFPVGFVIDQDDSEGDLMEEILSGAAHIRAAENPEHPVHIGLPPLSLMTFPMMGELFRRSMSVEEICEMAASHGIRRLDMMEAEIMLCGKARLKAALEAHGLSLGCLIATVSMSELPKVMIRTLIKKHLKTTKYLGCGRLMLVPMPQFEKKPRDDAQKKAKLDRVIRFLNEAVAEAAKSGITVCVEDTPSCDIPLCSIEDCRTILAAVPGLKLVFDTANMLARDDDPIVFYEQLKNHICHVHLKDVVYSDKESADRCVNGHFLQCVPWGEGIVPVREIYERLLDDGYKGICTLEFVSPKQKGLIANSKQLEHFLRYRLTL